MLLIPNFHPTASIDDPLTDIEYRTILKMWFDYEIPPMPVLMVAMEIERARRQVLNLFAEQENSEATKHAQEVFNELVYKQDEITTRAVAYSEKRACIFIIAKNIEGITETLLKQETTETREARAETWVDLKYHKNLISYFVKYFYNNIRQ